VARQSISNSTNRKEVAVYLEARKAPLEVLASDRAERVPIANEPAKDGAGLTSLLKAARTIGGESSYYGCATEYHKYTPRFLPVRRLC
jgi:hypothetical protein